MFASHERARRLRQSLFTPQLVGTRDRRHRRGGPQESRGRSSTIRRSSPLRSADVSNLSQRIGRSRACDERLKHSPCLISIHCRLLFEPPGRVSSISRLSMLCWAGHASSIFRLRGALTLAFFIAHSRHVARYRAGAPKASRYVAAWSARAPEAAFHVFTRLRAVALDACPPPHVDRIHGSTTSGSGLVTRNGVQACDRKHLVRPSECRARLSLHAIGAPRTAEIVRPVTRVSIPDPLPLGAERKAQS